MVKLFDFLKFRYSMPGQPLWYASIWCTMVTLNLLITLGAPQVTRVILVGHMS
jgi:hypothetical protein